jgi:hypothetical protein
LFVLCSNWWIAECRGEGGCCCWFVWYKAQKMVFYSLSLRNPPRRKSGGVGLRIMAVKDHSRQRDHITSHARKLLLCPQYGRSPPVAEISSLARSVLAERWVESKHYDNSAQWLSVQRTTVAEFVVFKTPRTKHQSLTNAEDFLAVRVGFQHYICDSSDY